MATKQSCLYNTNSTWATFLQGQGIANNVNFWRKDKRILHLAAGAAFYFKARGVQQVLGRGYFRENVNISVAEAWTRFGTGNGMPTKEAFFQGIAAFTKTKVSGDTQINCIVLDGIEWLASPVSLPVNFFPNAIQGAKFYQEQDVAFLASAFSSNALSEEAVTPQASDIDDSSSGPDRVEQTGYRILRDTKLAREVKALHKYRCQICNTALILANGEPYAEAHHLQPLGGDHRGPDKKANIICVCPNHHALLDYFAMSLSETEIEGHPAHPIGRAYLSYHNEKHQDRLSM